MQQHGKNMEIINEHEEGKGMLSNFKLQSGCLKAIDWFYRGNPVCCGPLASASCATYARCGLSCHV